MSIKKFALCGLSEVIKSSDNIHIDMVKTASGQVFIEQGSDKAKVIEAEIKKHPRALFFRAKAIVADEEN